MSKALQITFYFLLFSFELCFGQELTIHGVIKDKSGPVLNANIINKTKNTGSFSDDSGNFSIRVSKGDELEFSSIQHHKKSIEISDEILTQKTVLIQMHLKDYLLDEVEIKKTPLLGVLSVDSKFAKETKREEIMKRLGFNPYIKKKSAIDRKLQSTYSSSGIVPIGLLINALSGRLKLLKKQKELAENEKKMDYINKNFRFHIINDLKVDSTNVDRFIYFLHLDKKFNSVYNKGDMSLIPFLKEQSILFKKDSL